LKLKESEECKALEKKFNRKLLLSSTFTNEHVLRFETPTLNQYFFELDTPNVISAKPLLLSFTVNTTSILRK